MKPEQVYQSVHDRWTAFAAGDHTEDPGYGCAFCKLGKGQKNKCKGCPAHHALGMECVDHPLMEQFYAAYPGAESMSAAQDVLELLESIKDTILEYMEDNDG